MRSYCDACHGPKENLQDYLCNKCNTTKTEAMQHFAAENPGATQSDILYAGRMALNSVRHHANRNFVDPRDFSRQSGMFPHSGSHAAPPQRNLPPVGE